MSMTLLEQVKSSVTSQFAGYAAKLLGETPANIEKAVSLALPAILSGTASASHVASGQTGQSVVSRIVSDPVNDGTLLHRLPALYQGTMTAAPIYRLGAQLLQAIFGSKLGKVTQTIAALSGIKPASAALLVNTLAPHVLSILGKRHRMSGEATATGLAHLFDAEHTALAAAVPAALSQLIGTPVAANATAGSSTSKSTTAKSGSAAKLAAPVVAMPVVASQSVQSDARPTVTKQSYKWSSWLPVLAMYGLGAGGLALLLTSQADAPSPNPVTGVKSAQVSALAPAPALTKTAEVAKPAPPAPSVAPAVMPPAKTAEVTKPATPAPAPITAAPPKVAEVTKPTAPASAPAATTAPPKTVEVAKPVAPASPPPAAKTVEAAKTPVTAPAVPATPAPVPPKGTTSFFGTTPMLAEAAAKMNPDYKPATATPTAPAATNAASQQTAAAAPNPAAPSPAPATNTPAPVSPKGVTSFFGVTPPVAETAAKINPDYTPVTQPPPVAQAAPAAPATAPAPAPVPAGETVAKAAKAPDTKSAVTPPMAPTLPGVTSYFGTAPAPAEQAAIANSDYRPAPAPVKEPSLAQAALAAVTNFIAPTPPRPSGVTSYFGSTPTNQEAAARPNPDYKPSTTTPTVETSSTATISPTAAAPAAVPAKSANTEIAACRTSVANAVNKRRIVFQSARADLKNTSIATLDRLAAAFKTCPTARLKVEGHTDSTGQGGMNQNLSQARAQTVAAYLATKGIDSARMIPVGMGSARPVAPNTTALNKARNRRIEFTVENP